MAVPARLAGYLFAAICAATSVIAAVAAPLEFKALPLIPPGAQIVSGFDVGNNQYKTGGGSLLLITQNNVLDLRDWVALASVDPERSFSEVIQISCAPPGGALSEHLLLVTGHFDRKHIFRSAELNGARQLASLPEPVLAIEPFASERQDMTETRWLAILEDRIVVFGTPWIVRQVLFRFENRVPADPVLMNRLALFQRDVNCWNLVNPMEDSPQSLFLESDGPWSKIINDADLLMVGVHADSKIRVDLLLQTKLKPESVNLKDRAALFGRIFNQDAKNDEDGRRSLKKLELTANRLRASVLLSAQDFTERKRELLSRDKELLSIAREKERRAASTNPPRSNEHIPPHAD